VQPFRKYCLVNGFDDIGLTLRHADKIRAFERPSAWRTSMPWWLARVPALKDRDMKIASCRVTASAPKSWPRP
jgi:hypothetical protein